ncbi:glycosyltransferase [Bosea sp. (in: a-proteobacteria)]|uniref:glycosyltransferase n=1 Tax=Bosea sp. (in: a-proteobacteria) TaxID=1871050 RepID=UPI0026356F23|nr:glycosyltransferase [Bosea sp. (in: a-proteobacteria)]MCO5090664.1 glycosyltransferase [Bosea sp. (in: a-proteobacteria)]
MVLSSLNTAFRWIGRAFGPDRADPAPAVAPASAPIETAGPARDPAQSFVRHWRSLPSAGIGARAAGRRIVMLSVSNMRIDPRIEREARALSKAGYEVVVIWPDYWMEDGEHVRLDWGDGVTFEPLRPQAGDFIYDFPGFFGVEMLEAALRHECFAFHGHDIPSALVALTAAHRTGAHAVCDFHEWFSENVAWDVEADAWLPHKAREKKAFQCLERFALRRASELVTVCESIAEAMGEELGDGRKPLVVRNIPQIAQASSKVYPPLKRQLGLADDDFVLLWQGGTGPTRLIEPIIEALAFMPRCHFAIRGPSLDLFGAGYREIAARVGAADRLLLLDPVPSQDVVAAARGADAGIWTLPKLCRNFTFALPNKVFEYLASGLPVIAADYVEVRRIVDAYQVGALFDPYDPQSIAAAINPLIEDGERAAAIRSRIPGALERLNAESEWDKIPAIYDRLRRTGTAGRGA